MTSNDLPLGEDASFADILRPLSEEAFFAEHYDKSVVHIEGGADKFSSVMSWDILTSILNMTAIWSSASLQLVHDTKPVSPPKYCRSAKNRDGQMVLQPEGEKVMALLRRGASLVANDIDTLTPALRGVAAALEIALHGKAQANLYCSWKEHQAFGSHFDTHDVYAMHIAGEKLWRLYETRADVPIAHPLFKSYGQEWHDSNRGKVAREIVMRPGDLLYIPRGQYHDAIATSDGTIHIAFGVTHVIGMDALDLFVSMAVSDPLFRGNMPRPSSDAADAASWLAALGDRIAAFAKSDDAVSQMERYQKEFCYHRAGFDLPVTPADPEYRLTGRNLTTVQKNGVWVLTGPKGTVPIPAGLEEPVSWIVGRDNFSHGDLVAAFPRIAAADLETLLADLASMKVVARSG